MAKKKQVSPQESKQNIFTKNLTALLPVAAVAVTGIQGYATLKASVEQLRDSQVTRVEYGQLRVEFDEQRRMLMDAKVATGPTKIHDIEKEIDTLYVKAEDALRSVAQLKAEMYEFRGRCLRSCAQ